MMGRAARSNIVRTGGWRCSSTGSPACCHSCPPPSCRATAARGWMGGGGAWEVVPARPSCSPCSVVNLLFHVLGGAILITNYRVYYTRTWYIIHVPLAIRRACNQNTRIDKDYLMNITHTYYLLPKLCLCITKGVFNMLRWGAIVYTPCAWEGKLMYACTGFSADSFCPVL